MYLQSEKHNAHVEFVNEIKLPGEIVLKKGLPCYKNLGYFCIISSSWDLVIVQWSLSLSYVMCKFDRFLHEG